MEENDIRIGVDRLPLKAVQVVQESGIEHSRYKDDMMVRFVLSI